jgi:hypothetical protein
MRLAVEKIRRRLRAQRPGDKIGQVLLGIGDSARIAGSSLGESPARVREVKRDQEQVPEISCFRVSKTGDYRTKAQRRGVRAWAISRRTPKAVL